MNFLCMCMCVFISFMRDVCESAFVMRINLCFFVLFLLIYNKKEKEYYEKTGKCKANKFSSSALSHDSNTLAALIHAAFDSVGGNTAYNSYVYKKKNSQKKEKK